MTTDPLTDAELAALEAEHTPLVVPPCPVCGERLKVTESNSRIVTYHCSAISEAALADSVSSRNTFEVRVHWADSWWSEPATDPRVLRLLAEVRERRGEML